MKELSRKLIAEPVVRKVQKYKCTKTDQRIRQQLKQGRGFFCASCGKSFVSEKLIVHHILETRLYPEHARDSGNMMILCRGCHSKITEAEGLAGAAPLAFYAAISQASREIHVSFLRQYGNKDLINAFEAGNSQYWESKSSSAIVKWLTK